MGAIRECEALTNAHTVLGVAAVSPSVCSGCDDLYAHTVLGVAAVSPSVCSGCDDLNAHTVLAAVSPSVYSGCGDLCTHSAGYMFSVVQLWLNLPLCSCYHWFHQCTLFCE